MQAWSSACIFLHLHICSRSSRFVLRISQRASCYLHRAMNNNERSASINPACIRDNALHRFTKQWRIQFVFVRRDMDVVMSASATRACPLKTWTLETRPDFTGKVESRWLRDWSGIHFREMACFPFSSKFTVRRNARDTFLGTYAWKTFRVSILCRRSFSNYRDCRTFFLYESIMHTDVTYCFPSAYGQCILWGYRFSVNTNVVYSLIFCTYIYLYLLKV